jgi:hypothetical protein
VPVLLRLVYRLRANEQTEWTGYHLLSCDNVLLQTEVIFEVFAATRTLTLTLRHACGYQF